MRLNKEIMHTAIHANKIVTIVIFVLIIIPMCKIKILWLEVYGQSVFDIAYQFFTRLIIYPKTSPTEIIGGLFFLLVFLVPISIIAIGLAYTLSLFVEAILLVCRQRGHRGQP